jgi:hypothetical protein
VHLLDCSRGLLVDFARLRRRLLRVVDSLVKAASAVRMFGELAAVLAGMPTGLAVGPV